MLIAIAAILNAIAGLGNANERACGCTDGCTRECASRIATNGSSGKPANRSTAHTITGCSSLIRRAPAGGGADHSHRQDTVQDHSHRNILPILFMPFVRHYIGCILKGQDTPACSRIFLEPFSSKLSDVKKQVFCSSPNTRHYNYK
jgi:hypothetical protein